jgi:hypothetical protein
MNNMVWNPVETLKRLPPENVRLFYFFRPSGNWFVGVWDGCSFSSRYGFCDRYDAPWWHPMAPTPELADDERDG